MLAFTRAVWLVPCLVAPVVAGEECAAHADCAGDDESSLLQVARSSPARRSGDAPGPLAKALAASKLSSFDPVYTLEPASSPNVTCPFGEEVRPLIPSQTSFMVDQGLVPDKYLGWWNYPVQQDLDMLDRLKADLDPVPWAAEYVDRVGWIDMRAGPAKDVLPMMHEATHTPAVVSKVPEKLRGIFWMKGNAVAEELVVLHNGHWFEEEHVFHTTQQPFTWAFTGGKPPGVSKAPWSYKAGYLYSDDTSKAMFNAKNMVGSAAGISFAFERCKSWMQYCDPKKDDDMAFGYMELNPLANLENASKLGKIFDSFMDTGGMADGVFTLQAMSDDGSHWKRTCHWGTSGCAFFDFGSYDLVRVMDYDGTPVQPHYNDFLEFMGDVPLVLWTGWDNATAKREVAQAYADRLGTGTYADIQTVTVPDNQ